MYTCYPLHRTGDTAVLEGTPPYWRILGRTNVDIIKSGGYKISALAIENVLLSNSRIKECAVLGLPDEFQGEVIAVVVACQDPPVRQSSLYSVQNCMIHNTLYSIIFFATRSFTGGIFLPYSLPYCAVMVHKNHDTLH